MEIKISPNRTACMSCYNAGTAYCADCINTNIEKNQNCHYEDVDK